MIQLHILLLSSFACLAASAPSRFGPATRAYFHSVSDRYENLRKTQSQRSMPSCDNYILSQSMSNMNYGALPPPADGLVPYHVAIGRGTQNYTCQAANVNSSATPVAVGAMAQLYNFSCAAGTSNPSLQYLPAATLEHKEPKPGKPLFPANDVAKQSGNHYFADLTTPTFNFNLDDTSYGIVFSKLANKIAAPTDDATNGPGIDPKVQDAAAVPWLKLKVQGTPAIEGRFASENKGQVKEVYRLNTAGGTPPKDCSAFPDGGDFQLQYSAEYWFLA